jgi:hypothetical protein
MYVYRGSKFNKWSNIVPTEYYSTETVSPYNDAEFSVLRLHQSYHHYLQVDYYYYYHSYSYSYSNSSYYCH